MKITANRIQIHVRERGEGDVLPDPPCCASSGRVLRGCCWCSRRRVS
ncbi:hypothetical protein [Sorangium cellulosum]|nr:hypothetical protein [Sorangium cellulosum]